MKLFWSKILPLALCVAALIAGFLILLNKTNQNKPILILGGFIFLAGTWGSAIVVDSFFEKPIENKHSAH